MCARLCEILSEISFCFFFRILAEKEATWAVNFKKIDPEFILSGQNSLSFDPELTFICAVFISATR